jgi:stage IV sporulation protein FB
MRTSLSFRLAGIPVRVDAIFFVVVVILGARGRPGVMLAGWVVAVFVSILVHELGHAVAFRTFGQSPRIRLWAWGGLTSGSGQLSPGRDVVVSLAGSAAALLLLGLPAYAVTRTVSFTSFEAYVFWHDLLWVSLWWSLLNLLPLLPFDGGLVARTVLRRAMGERGDVTALWLSISVAAVGSVWALSQREPFLAMYGIFVAGFSAERLIDRRDAPLRDELDRARRELTNDPATAGVIARGVVEQARGRSTHIAASDVVAWAALAREDDVEAREAVRGMGPAASPPPVLEGCLLLAAGDSDRGLERLAAGMAEHPSSFPIEAAMLCIARASATDELTTRLLDRGPEGANAASTLALGMHLIGRYHSAVEVAERVYADGRADRSVVAYNAACSAARGGWADLALRWLKAAIANGFDDEALLETDADLETLRRSPAFDPIRSSLSPAPSR